MLTILVAISCVDVSKRKHRRGFHVEWRGNNKSKSISAQKKENEIKKGIALSNIRFSEIKLEIPQEKFKEDRLVLSYGINKIESSEEKALKPTVLSLSKAEEILVKTESSKNQNTGFIYSIGILLGGASLFFLSRKKIKKKAEWASKNKTKAQLIIAGLSVTIPMLGLTAGAIHGDAEMTTAKMTIFGGVGLVSVLSHFFSKKKRFRFKGFMLLLATLGMAFTLGGKMKTDSAKSSQEKVEVSVNDSKANSTGGFASASVDDEVPFGIMILKFLGTVGLLIVGFYAAFLIAILSCSLACSGYGALALVFLVVGLVGLVILITLLIRWLWRTNARRRKEKYKKKKIIETKIFIGILVLIAAMIAVFGYIQDFFDSPF